MKEYDEKKYLAIKDLSFFEEDKISLEYEKEYEKYFYETLIKNYEEFISMAAMLIKKLDVCNNPAAKSIIINRLIYNGFFSINGRHIYQKNPYFELQSKMGFNVILGKGCCRNVTLFHKDIFDKLDEYFSLYFCKTNPKNLSLNKMQSKIIDHVVSVIKPNEDNIMGYDMSYDIFLRPINGYQMDVLRGYQGSHNIVYKPYGEYIMLGTNITDLRKNIEIYDNASKNNVVSLGTLVDMRTEVEDSIINNQNLLNKFHKETKVLVKEMNKETKKHIKSYI